MRCAACRFLSFLFPPSISPIICSESIRTRNRTDARSLRSPMLFDQPARFLLCRLCRYVNRLQVLFLFSMSVEIRGCCALLDVSWKFGRMVVCVFVQGFMLLIFKASAHIWTLRTAFRLLAIPTTVPFDPFFLFISSDFLRHRTRKTNVHPL